MLLMGGEPRLGLQNPACPRERESQPSKGEREDKAEGRQEREREREREERGVRAKGRVWVIRQKQKVK